MKGQLKPVKGVLYRKTILDNSAERKPSLQLILPTHLTKKVLNSCHDQVGHQGIVRTLSLLRERFYWPGMHKQATLYVSKCQNCLKRKAIPDEAPLQPIIASQPMELVHMDFLSIEPSKGNIKNVLVITDILQDMHKPMLVKPKQHKLLLSCCGRTLLHIMAFQRNSYLIRAEIVKVN